MLSCAVEQHVVEYKGLTQEEVSQLKEIGVDIGSNQMHSILQKSSYIIPCNDSAEHLKALDKFFLLLANKNPEIVKQAWTVFTDHLDCAKSLSALDSKKSEYKLVKPWYSSDFK